MARGVFEDYAHGIQSVAAAGERQCRFAAVFVWQLAHDGGTHIRWIADDQIITASAQRRKIIGLNQFNFALEPVISDIASRDVERIRRQIAGIDMRARKTFGQHNRKTTGAGA